jgi:hypothetical protein
MLPSLRRRRFLQAMGLSAGSLFLPSRLRAQGSAPPKRFVVVFTQHGFVYDAFKMRPAGASDAVNFDVPFSEFAESDYSRILRPLQPFADRLLAIDGLSMASAEADVVFNEHDKGTRHALTGARIVSGEGTSYAGGPSIDQLIARQIRVPDRLSSLEFGVTGPTNGGAIWRDAAQPLPPDADPRGALTRLFPPADGGEVNHVRAGQASVLDLVKSEYDRLLPRLSGDDRQKLQLHRDLVRAAEQRVQALDSLTCTRPNEPALVDDFSSVEHYESRFDAFVDITAAALACDLTRVVSLQLSQLRNDHLGIVGDVHADYAHTSETNPTAIDVMTRYGEVHAGHLLRLLTALDNVPEGNGTLLDNTVVLWCSELATGTHKYNVWPAIVAGGAGLRTGRYVRQVPGTANANPNPGWSGVDAVIGRPHHHLLTTLASAVGATVDVLGQSELLTTEGERVDLTGGMPELVA